MNVYWSVFFASKHKIQPLDGEDFKASLKPTSLLSIFNSTFVVWALIGYQLPNGSDAVFEGNKFYWLTFWHSARRWRPRVIQEVQVVHTGGRKCQRNVSAGDVGSGGEHQQEQ